MTLQRKRSPLLRPSHSEWSYRRNNKRRYTPALGKVGDKVLDSRWQRDYPLEPRFMDRREEGARDLFKVSWRSTYYWNSRKNGRQMLGESHNEAAYGMLLDAEFEPLSYRTQPLAIELPPSKSGEPRHHIPDFEVIRDNERFLVEVKHDDYVDSWRTSERDQAVQDYCVAHGCHYAIASTSEIYMEPRFTNARRLEQSYWILIDDELIAKIIDVVAVGAKTVGDILQRLPNDRVDINIICGLHTRGLLKLDYLNRFNTSSGVVLP